MGQGQNKSYQENNKTMDGDNSEICLLMFMLINFCLSSFSVRFKHLSGVTAPCGPGKPHYRVFTIILRHTTLSKTPLDE